MNGTEMEKKVNDAQLRIALSVDALAAIYGDDAETNKAIEAVTVVLRDAEKDLEGVLAAM